MAAVACIQCPRCEWSVGVRSGCPRACVQSDGSDELVCSVGGVVMVVDAVWVLTDVGENDGYAR